MSSITANDGRDDFDRHHIRTFVFKAVDASRWQVSMDTKAPALQPENAPYN